MMNVIRAFEYETLNTVVNNVDGLLAGVDEAGRGPLAGPVVAAAVVLDPAKPVVGLDDSKKLSEKKRNELAAVIQRDAISWSLGSASVEEIDDINILNATMLAMQRAVTGLTYEPAIVLVDGNRTPRLDYISYALIKGDQWQDSISAASILAKVERDYQMLELDQAYPQYGFSQHKGYPTKMHIEILQVEGICPAHRKSFGPVTRLIEQ
ncbi:MAG: ribonuclease HII [Acidiferrobacterales bacterium]